MGQPAARRNPLDFDVSLTLDMLPLVAVQAVDVADANRLLVQWGHPLGACNRPFHSDAHVMLVDGAPIAATVSATTVSSTVAGYGRTEVVELARIGRAPGQRWVMRPMLRIWREAIAPRWPQWTVRTAVSYALPGHPGDIYRFDGWERIGTVRRSGAGGTWTRKPAVNAMPGLKTLWVYRYPADER